MGLFFNAKPLKNGKGDYPVLLIEFHCEIVLVLKLKSRWGKMWSWTRIL